MKLEEKTINCNEKWRRYKRMENNGNNKAISFDSVMSNLGISENYNGMCYEAVTRKLLSNGLLIFETPVHWMLPE